ncbi:uncharacterized protein LOC125254548 [Megalobrama amblycephala]|uniref:uncharacterized protein LOC125254548 n=1 Tax=Megalobrama amblycephala TaxID=75352 RepID=UPI002013D1F5|nr:uncharacterized protein LOC125254548 [Megalobrama amblycephala]
MEISLMAAQHIQAVSGAFMDSQHNGNTPLQTSTSNLNAILPKPAEKEEEDETIWLLKGTCCSLKDACIRAYSYKNQMI